MRFGILRYESRPGGGPMQTSSSANRTCRDSRSASLYTATVAMPSSRHARITRRAISPRLAISTFLNIRLGLATLLPGDVGEGPVGRALDAAEAQCELARIARVEQRHLVADHALVIPLHQRLVEGLHAV